MAVVIIPNLAATPLIDAVSPNDYLLVGDQSDGGELKRVLIESLPGSSIGKLAIANYDWSTIPNKPLDLSPDKLAIANYDWSTIPNKPTVFPAVVDWANLLNKPSTFPSNPVLDFIKQSTKPLARVDGSALQIGDRWLNTTDLVQYIFNGTYWVSAEVFSAPSTSGGSGNVGSSGSNAAPYCGLGLRRNILLVSVTYLLRILRTNDSTNNWTIQANLFNTSGAGSNIGSPVNTFTDWSLPNSTGYTQRELLLNNTFVTAQNFYDIRFTYTKNGGPANFGWSYACLNYRLVSP